jgi:Fur family ferric uptake transcriptional regulator
VRDCSGVHFHLKCKKCGELIHTRGRALLEIAKSICDDYNFEIDASCTVFYGVCGTCADKGST